MSDLVLSQVGTLVGVSKEYSTMVDHIQKNLPEVQKASQNFYKSASQYKNATLDVTDMTPMSAIKHVLAVIDKTRAALEEAHIKVRRSQLELKEKQQKFDSMFEGQEKDELEVEIVELSINLQRSEASVKGAIRKLSFFMTQYQSLLEKIGKDSFTEEDFEKEEAKHHIMLAIKQAMIAARARGGLIDEGNHIYFFDLGINGAVLQKEMTAYFEKEQELLNKGIEPTHELTMAWIEALAEKFIDAPTKYANYRGLVTYDEKSTLRGLFDNEENN